MIPIPEHVARTIAGVHQEKGRRWLERYDELVLRCLDKWSLRPADVAPFPLSYNVVAPVIRIDGSDAVLKLGVPGKDMDMEIAAVRLYDGKGMARLIDADPEQGAFLLERVKPGLTLKSVEDDEAATMAAASVMRKLHVPAPSGTLFPSTADCAKGLNKLRIRYDGGTGPLPERAVRKAERLFAELHETAANPLLLHGDLHHDNILSAEREPWLAIDPKGLIGEAEYGVIPYLMNHLPEHNAAEIIRRRISIFADELGLRKKRIAEWSFCHAVLSAWWCIEDQTDGADDAIDTALLFESLMEEIA
ncbi:aminoglycoside phosphotransferase family protein [Paenibacillus sp. MBLB4367]|uniref:aminoglycoside phosphotransferase family protein n=1 Tax=Paenibacillus sp. MBLB4367 TaxID=3384767 RepID=UPI0039084283